jgi:hypothetical protein
LQLRASASSLVLAYFDIGGRPQFPGLHAFVNAIQHANVPQGTTIYAGTYGHNLVTADAIDSLPSGTYAPLLPIHETDPRGPYGGRHLPQSDLDKLDPRYGGAIPLRETGKPLPRSDYLNWGRELGYRFRDGLRHSGRNGAAIATTWQFDEVVSEVLDDPHAVPYRLYVAGVLQGLHRGRTELGDPRQKGIVWAAERTLAPLPTLPTPTGSPLAILWDAIDNASRLYVGEEYVVFEGDPRRAANASSLGQRRLLAAGPTRQRIGHKYAVGTTPGLRPSAPLGGNVHGWPLAQVNRWPEQFIQARAARVRVAGFGVFDFTHENSAPDVMRAAIEAAANPIPT